jgi:hypothetical protein
MCPNIWENPPQLSLASIRCQALLSTNKLGERITASPAISGNALI